MSNLFIKYRDNWADEMDLFGFAIIQKDKWEALLVRMQKFFDRKGEWNFGVGTNEDVEYSSYDGWLQHFTVTELSEAESEALLAVSKRTKLGPDDESHCLVQAGFFGIPYDLNEGEEDDDETDETDEVDEDLSEVLDISTILASLRRINPNPTE